jgi:hypothetical protein
MNTSEHIGKIAPALLRAQRAITFAVKDSKNPQFRSTYADLSSVIDATKPALNEAGISFVQMPAPSEPGTLALTTRLIHETGEWIESTATCPLQKHDPQGYGSAITYLRRYSLASAVGLYQDDDDGNAASRKGAVAASFRSSPTMGAMEDVDDPDKVLYLQMLGTKISAMVQKGNVAEAWTKLQSEKFDDTDATALWSLLDSKVRTALKKHKETITQPTKEEAAA